MEERITLYPEIELHTIYNDITNKVILRYCMAWYVGKGDS